MTCSADSLSDILRLIQIFLNFVPLFFHSNLRATVLVFRTQLAVTHIHDLAFEWSVYRVRLIFYCSKHHMALMAVKGLSIFSSNS